MPTLQSFFCCNFTVIFFCHFLGSGIGKCLTEALESLLGLSAIETDTAWLVADTSGGTEAKLRQWFSRIRTEGRPCLAVLKDIGRLGKNREGKTDHRVLDRVKEEMKSLDKSLGIVALGECEALREVDKGLAVCFDVKMDVLEREELSLEDRAAVLKWVCRRDGRTKIKLFDFMRLLR